MEDVASATLNSGYASAGSSNESYSSSGSDSDSDSDSNELEFVGLRSEVAPSHAKFCWAKSKVAYLNTAGLAAAGSLALEATKLKYMEMQQQVKLYIVTLSTNSIITAKAFEEVKQKRIILVG